MDTDGINECQDSVATGIAVGRAPKIIYVFFVSGACIYFFTTYHLHDILMEIGNGFWQYVGVNDVLRVKVMGFIYSHIYNHQLMSIWSLYVSYMLYSVLVYGVIFNSRIPINNTCIYLLLAVTFLICVNYSGLIIFRRTSCFILLLPIGCFCFNKVYYYFKLKENSRFGLKQFWIFLSLAIAIIPGFYLPPFYDGIAGWSMRIDPDYSSVQDWKIEFDDGSREWFRPSFYNPITIRFRVYSQHRKHLNSTEMEAEFPKLLYCLYVSAFEQLDDGFLPTQSFLGKFSYPPHTLDAFPENSKYLEPKRIRKFVYVRYEIRNGIVESFEELDEFTLKEHHKECRK